MHVSKSSLCIYSNLNRMIMIFLVDYLMPLFYRQTNFLIILENDIGKILYQTLPLDYHLYQTIYNPILHIQHNHQFVSRKFQFHHLQLYLRLYHLSILYHLHQIHVMRNPTKNLNTNLYL